LIGAQRYLLRLSDQADPQVSVKTNSGAVNSGNLTMENYERIHTNLTLSQVEDTLGEGTEQANSNVDAGRFSSSASAYMWQSGIKSISVVFQTGRVLSKAHFGLD
jgi:hypothetical protein